MMGSCCWQLEDGLQPQKFSGIPTCWQSLDAIKSLGIWVTLLWKVCYKERAATTSPVTGTPLPAGDTGPTTIAVLSLLLPELSSTLCPWLPIHYLSTAHVSEEPGCLTDPEQGWEPVRFTGVRPTTRNLTREDFKLARNSGFARSEHRDHQFSSLPIKFPMPAPYSLEEINEKEGLGEMNFGTSHISVRKQRKVSRVYFISTAQEVSVPKIALIPASAPCYFWHLCKLICKNPLRSPWVSLSSLHLECFTAKQSCSYPARLKQLSALPAPWPAQTLWLQLLNTHSLLPEPALSLPLPKQRKRSQLRHADRGTSHLLYRSAFRGISWERPCCLVSVRGFCCTRDTLNLIQRQ